MFNKKPKLAFDPAVKRVGVKYSESKDIKVTMNLTGPEIMTLHNMIVHAVTDKAFVLTLFAGGGSVESMENILKMDSQNTRMVLKELGVEIPKSSEQSMSEVFGWDDIADAKKDIKKYAKEVAKDLGLED